MCAQWEYSTDQSNRARVRDTSSTVASYSAAPEHTAITSTRAARNNSETARPKSTTNHRDLVYSEREISPEDGMRSDTRLRIMWEQHKRACFRHTSAFRRHATLLCETPKITRNYHAPGCRLSFAMRQRNVTVVKKRKAHRQVRGMKCARGVFGTRYVFYENAFLGAKRN